MVKAHWSLMLLVATSHKLNWQQGSNALLVKNRDDPVVSEAWLFAAHSASGSHSA
jgi:hypothetical protein